MAREKIELEYVIRSSPTILYNFIKIPSHLSLWFSDGCDANGNHYTFYWEGYSEEAELVEDVDMTSVKYQWDGAADDEFFEMKISKNEISGDTVLTVVDFCDDDEVEDQKMLWDSQISQLVRNIGG